MAFAPSPLVPPIIRQPLPYGLFSVVSFRPDDSSAVGWRNGIRWEVGTCEGVDGLGEVNCDPTAPKVEKNLDPNGGTVAHATPFTVYGHFSCGTVGYDYDTAQQLAVAHLTTREEARVEQALWTGDLGNTPALAPGAEVVSVGDKPEVALGKLEAFIATHYGSLGVIHMSREMATILTARMDTKTSGGSLYTALGTPVVAGAGYPGTGPLGEPVGDDGSQWIYASPAISGYRSEVFAPQDETGGWINPRKNDITALAERTYTLGFDPCGVGAANINPAL